MPRRIELCLRSRRLVFYGNLVLGSSSGGGMEGSRFVYILADTPERYSNRGQCRIRYDCACEGCFRENVYAFCPHQPLTWPRFQEVLRA